MGDYCVLSLQAESWPADAEQQSAFWQLAANHHLQHHQFSGLLCLCRRCQSQQMLNNSLLFGIRLQNIIYIITNTVFTLSSLQAVPRPPDVEQQSAFLQQGSRGSPSTGRMSQGLQPVTPSVLPNLRVLELTISGELNHSLHVHRKRVLGRLRWHS